MLKLYQILTCLASPVIDLYLQRRKAKGKEDPVRFPERLGYASRPRPTGKLVWVHGASVGESLSILPLLNALMQRYPQHHFLMTTGTVSSAAMMEKRLPAGAFHQYIPVDRLPAVKRFLEHWQPDVALWIESELWPNLVTQTAARCPLLLLNGRISEHSFRNWQRYPSLGKRVMESFSLVLPQSKHDAVRFEALGAKQVRYLGNIKFDSPPLPADPQKLEALQSAIGQRPVWLTASTHAPEEDIAGHTHLALKKQYPDLLTLIVPRHPNRASDIAGSLRTMGLQVSTRSLDEPITATTDIYLADTMGELGIFYRLAPIVFIGGSLIPHGGQNPLEAARLNCAILYGPHMENFLEIKRELEEAQASLCVEGEQALAPALAGLLANPQKQQALTEAASLLVQTKSGVIAAYIEQLSPYLEPKSHAHYEAA